MEHTLKLYKIKKTLWGNRAEEGYIDVAWDRDNYIEEAENLLGDKDFYEEVCNDRGPLISTIHKAIKKIC